MNKLEIPLNLLEMDILIIRVCNLQLIPIVEVKQHLVSQSLGELLGKKETDGRETANVGRIVCLGPFIWTAWPNEVFLWVG